MGAYEEYSRTIGARLEYYKGLELPMVFNFTGGQNNKLGLYILDYFDVDFSLYVSVLPCHTESMKAATRDYLSEIYPNITPIYVNCGASCVPLDDNGNIANLFKYRYWGACSRASERIDADFADREILFLNSYVYTPFDCPELCHIKPDILGLSEPNRNISDRFWNGYLFYPYSQPQLDDMCRSLGIYDDNAGIEHINSYCKELKAKAESKQWYYDNYPNQTSDAANARYQAIISQGLKAE